MNELIEHLRWKMIHLADYHGSLTHPDVVSVSEQLDGYILKAQHVMRDCYTTTGRRESFISVREPYELPWGRNFTAVEDTPVTGL